MTATHQIQAEYLGVEDGNVGLRREDGREISVPLASLSKADLDRVAALQTAVASPNPFE